VAPSAKFLIMGKWLPSLFLFFLFWLISFVFYFKTAGAGFVTDEIGWLQNYNDTGWLGLFNAFGDKSLHFNYHLTGFLIWKLFGLNGFAWFLVFITLHAAVAALSFEIFNSLLSDYASGKYSVIAFAGTLLFLVSPYQTEVMVWYACIHYLVCSLLLLIAFRVLLLYLKQPALKWIIVFYCCYITALFTLEISFAFPIILFFFLLFYPSKVFYGVDRIKLIKIFLLPSLAGIIFYLLLSKLLRGSAVGHYGASAHLNFSIPLIMANLSKYVSKIFLLTQFFPSYIKQKLYSVIEIEKFGWVLFGVLSVITFYFFLSFHKLKNSTRIAFLILSFFAIAMQPVLNLYFSSIVNIEGDRFTYFASIFAYQFIAFSCIIVFRRLGWVLLLVFLIFNIKFLQLNTNSWSRSLAIQNSLLSDFKWKDSQRIFLLNIPDNFRGAYMYRSTPPDNFFAKTIAFKTGIKLEDRITEIAEYNMNSVSDSVTVERLSDNELKVTFAQWGNWWWLRGIGANSYSTKDYEVKFDEWSHSYQLLIKNKLPNTVYLYQCAGRWRQVENF